jgi:hypothetical protein
MVRIAERVMVVNDDRLTPAYGDNPERVRCLANGDGDPESNARDLLVDLLDEWLDRWTWCPGNHTRYDLMYGCRKTGEPHNRRSEFTLGYLNPMGRAGAMMIFSEPSYLHHTYIEEKLGVNTADAVGIMMFLEQMGHSVGYPDNEIMNEMSTTYGWDSARR